MTRIITNKYEKKCQCCKINVPVGEGFAYNDGGWKTVCASEACFRKLGLEKPKPVGKGRITVDGKLFMPYNGSALPLLRSIPGGRWDSVNKCRTFSTKPGDLPRVIEIADKLGLEVPNELRKKAAAGTEESRDAEKRASTIGLYDYQRDGVRFLALHDKALLADDQGLGKTPTTLAALPDNARVLVVAPASLKYNWAKEAKKWRPEFKTTVLSGRESFRAPNENEIVITNYEILSNEFLPTPAADERTRPEFLPSSELAASMKGVIVVADECQKVRNYKTKLAKKFSNLSRLAAKVWGLSGTPMENRPGDLFGVLCSLNMNVFGKWNYFASLFGGYKNGWGGWEFGTEPSPEVSERLRRVMIRRLKKDVLKDLPPKTYQTIEVNGMTPVLEAQLRELAIELAVESAIGGETYEEIVKKVDKDLDHLLSTLDASMLPKFRQFAKIRAELARSRIPAAIEIIETYEESDTPLIVFSAHKDPVYAIAERDGWEAITGDTSDKERQRIVDDFQDGKLKGVALTIIAGGVGFTLTRASDALFIDLDWTPSKNLQAQDRLHRIGQLNSVLIKMLVGAHPLDKHVHNLLEKKMRMIDAALESQAHYDATPIVNDKMPKLRAESDEELNARLAAIEEAEKEIERKEAVDRVHGILDRERKRAKMPEPKLTKKRKELIRQALIFMVNRCDGAIAEDYMGFNKPDAGIAHYVARTGMRDDDENTFRVMERVLSRYYKTQLKGKYDEIWQ